MGRWRWKELFVCVGGCGYCVALIRWVCNDSNSMFGCHFQVCLRDATISGIFTVDNLLLSSTSFEIDLENLPLRAGHISFIFFPTFSDVIQFFAQLQIFQPEAG